MTYMLLFLYMFGGLLVTLVGVMISIQQGITGQYIALGVVLVLVGILLCYRTFLGDWIRSKRGCVSSRQNL